MTILYPKAFARSPAAGFDGTFDWDFLLPALAGTLCKPMDVDCVIERSGRFLGFETKENAKVPIPGGQLITLAALARAGWTIVILRAKRAEDIAGWEIWRYDARAEDGVRREYCDGDAAALTAHTRRWFLGASERRRAPPLWRPGARQGDLWGSHLMSAPEQALHLYYEVFSDSQRADFLATISKGQ